MDATAITAAAQPAGFYAWVMANGQVIAFFAQMIYWLALVVLLAYAVWQYKRWVNFQLGTGRSGALRTGEPAVQADKTDDSALLVEEFVE